MQKRGDQGSRELAATVLVILRCPAYQSGVRQDDSGLVCPSCQRMFLPVRGVLRFVDQQFYTGSFGFQWLKHEKTQLDNSGKLSERDFIRRTGLRPGHPAGTLLLT